MSREAFLTPNELKTMVAVSLAFCRVFGAVVNATNAAYLVSEGFFYYIAFPTHFVQMR
jgi:hypothetical protein